MESNATEHSCTSPRASHVRAASGFRRRRRGSTKPEFRYIGSVAAVRGWFGSPEARDFFTFFVYVRGFLFHGDPWAPCWSMFPANSLARWAPPLLYIRA